VHPENPNKLAMKASRINIVVDHLAPDSSAIFQRTRELKRQQGSRLLNEIFI
jgi:hypothetical protein